MNNQMITNSQLSTTEPKETKTKTKQTTRTGTESEKWTSHGGFSVCLWGGIGGKVQRIKSVIAGHKIDKERSTMVEETENSKNLYVQPMDMN